MDKELRFLAAIRDIHMYGSEIRSILEGVSFQDYQADLRLRLLVERCLSIVGEACVRIRNIGESDRLPNTEKIIRFRNILIHAYDGIDPATVWTIVQNHLPSLLDVAHTLLTEGNRLGEYRLEE